MGYTDDESDEDDRKLIFIRRATTFIEEEVPKIDERFRADSQFNEQRARFEPKTPDFTRTLEETIRQHATPLDLGVGSEFNSWEDAFKSLGQDNYIAKAGKIKKAWWRLGEKGEIISKWLEIIPDTHGIGVLRAGLTLVLHYAENSVKEREAILGTFNEVARMANEIELRKDSFNWNKKTVAATADLYGALANIMVELLKLGSSSEGDQRSSSKSKPLTFFSASKRKLAQQQQVMTSTDLAELVTEMRKKAETLKSTIDTSRDNDIRKIAKGTANIEIQTNQIRMTATTSEVTTRKISSKVDEMSVSVNNIQPSLKKVENMMERLETKLDSRPGPGITMEHFQAMFNQEQQKAALYADLTQASQFNTLKCDLQNSMLAMLMENYQNFIQLHAQQMPQFNMQNQQTAPSRAVTTLKALLACLTSNEAPDGTLEAVLMEPHDTLKTILVRGARIEPRSQKQAQSAMSRPEFQNWMQLNHPTSLLIDGGLQPSSIKGGISAMSYFCATLAVSLPQIPRPCVVLQFFCGLHARTDGFFYGPNGLVRSLIIQMLGVLETRKVLSLEFIDSRDYLAALENHDLNALCSTVHHLVRQFPPDVTVYCIIDNLITYDTYELEQQLGAVLWRLQSIVGDDSLRAPFKILWTNPLRSTAKLQNMLQGVPQVALSQNWLAPRGISENYIQGQLSMSRPRTPVGRPVTPTPDVGVSPGMYYPNGGQQNGYGGAQQNGYGGGYGNGGQGNGGGYQGGGGYAKNSYDEGDDDF